MSPLAVRRCVYGVLLLSLSVAVLLQLGFPERPTQRVERVFEAIEKLPEGSRVLLSLDYDPAAEGELSPMAAAFVRHLSEKRHKIIFMTLWETGVPILQKNVKIVRTEYAGRMVEGRDFVDLGYKPGRQVAITNAMADLSKDFPTDSRGISLKSPQMELTRNLRNFSELDLLISVGAGYPGVQEWIQYAATPKRKLMLAGSPGVQAPQLFPYVPSQLYEVLVAIKGAAEYEDVLIRKYPQLAGRLGAREGRRRMGPQVVAHVLIVGLIVLGNVLTFTNRRR
jgi:hypothetical protein